MTSRIGAFVLAALAIGGPALRAQQPTRSDTSYLFFVASSGVDQVALVRFGRAGLRVEHRTAVTLDVAGHYGLSGLSVAPDGRSYYLTTTRDFPGGELIQVAIARDSSPVHERQPPDTVKAIEPLGGRPTALQIGPDGVAWVTNPGPGGAGTVSSVSAIYTGSMVEVARVPTCGDARGSRLSADGSKHYSVCTADDLLVEIDTRHMNVARRLVLSRGAEHGDSGAARAASAGDSACAPTALELSHDGSRVYVACGRGGDVVEIDVATWSLRRRIPAGAGLSRIAVTHDGKLLLAASPTGQSVAIIDLASGQAVAQLAVPRHVAGMDALRPDESDPFMALMFASMVLPRAPTGMIVSPDDRYVFVSVAGIGVAPGTVEIIDLATRTFIASVAVAPDPQAMDFWKMEPRP